MRLRNKWFTLILWTIIIIITGSLMLEINHGKYVTPINQETNLYNEMITVSFNEVANTWYTPHVLDLL